MMAGDGTSTYNHNLGINAPSCKNGDWIREDAWSASSQHGGGANVAFADGHAQTLKQTIDLKVWRALSTRSGGEVVDASTY